MINEKVPHSFFGGSVCWESLEWGRADYGKDDDCSYIQVRLIGPLKSYLNAKKSQHFNVQQVEYFFALLCFGISTSGVFLNNFFDYL